MNYFRLRFEQGLFAGFHKLLRVQRVSVVEMNCLSNLTGTRNNKLVCKKNERDSMSWLSFLQYKVSDKV